MKWTTETPKVQGWYWCRNRGDDRGEIWEAVVRMDETASGLVCSWMTAPGEADTMHEGNFSPECMWAGPLLPPDERVAYIVIHGIMKPRA